MGRRETNRCTLPRAGVDNTVCLYQDTGTSPTAALIEKLVQMQETEGEDGRALTDGEFAARLGVSRSAWQGLRTGAFPPGRRALGLIMTAFPLLAPEAMACLLPRNASKVNVSASKQEVA